MRSSKQNSGALEPARQAVAEVEAALKEGRTPRARKPLKEAARLFQDASEFAEAVRALLVLSDLEERRDEPDRALSAARSALRVARRSAEGALDSVLARLCRLYSRAGDHARAVSYADERLDRAGDAGRTGSLLASAVTRWSAGNHGEALALAEAAVDGTENPEAERVLAVLLLQSGCPSDAAGRLTKLTRATDDTAALMARGWCWVCLDRTDSAARDFRRALRHAKQSGDRRTEIEASAALAATETARSAAEPNAARETRARALSARVARMARRYRDAGLGQLLKELDAWTGRADIAGRDEAARALVELSSRSESLALADAAVREVERLAALPAGAPAYGCPLPVPLLLE